MANRETGHAEMQNRTLLVDGHLLKIVHGGNTSGPIVLFLHGYPDSSRVWYELMQALSDEFRVVAFDLRGVAGSAPPRKGKEYHIESLLPDIEAVINEIGGNDCKVHLVGHDWGSTIGWSFICHPDYSGRVLSWSSMSGPHLGIWIRWGLEGLKSMSPTRIKHILLQALRSTYVLVLLAIPIPELLWLIFGVKGWKLALRFAGVPASDDMLDENRSKVLSMTLRPMSLYRRNILSPPPVPPKKSIGIPTLLIIATKDTFLAKESFDNLHEYVCNLTKLEIDGSHWSQRSHPELIRDQLRRFLTQNRVNS